MSDLQLKLERDDLRVHGIRARNPGPMTLTGTNTYIVETAGEVWVIDPGPNEYEHLQTVAAVALEAGNIGGVALTHDHGDHSDGLAVLLALLGDPPLLRYPDQARISSPLTALHTPGHAPDHLVFMRADVLFSGDMILGGSSTIVPPGGGTLIAYLSSLRSLADLQPALILPGHGDPIEQASIAINAQVEHRLMRERDLVAALVDGLRDRDELVRRVWHDVPANLRVAAAVTMQAHLEKLDIEGRLPNDFEPDGRAGWKGG